MTSFHSSICKPQSQLSPNTHGLPSSDATALFTGIFSLLILKSNKLHYAGLCGLRDPANRYEHAPTSIQNEV